MQPLKSIVPKGVEESKLYNHRHRDRKRVARKKSDMSNNGHQKSNQSQYSVSSINVDLTSIYPSNAKNIKSSVMSKDKQGKSKVKTDKNQRGSKMRQTLEPISPGTEMIEEEKNSMPISRVETILGR